MSGIERANGNNSSMKLSVIIPTLNEVLYLSRAVESIRKQATLIKAPEIIVTDCHSEDGTLALAYSLDVKVVTRNPPFDNRAAALNAGVLQATGDVLLFLHADSIPPMGYDQAIQSILSKPSVVGGAFEFHLDGPRFGLRVVETINRIRYRIWPKFYGDQGIFSEREAFHAVGGYPEQGILEDSDFCAALRRVGEIALIKKPMLTSPRRFHEEGIYRVLARDIRIWWRDLIGLQTEQFAVSYRENNKERGKLSLNK